MSLPTAWALFPGRSSLGHPLTAQRAAEPFRPLFRCYLLSEDLHGLAVCNCSVPWILLNPLILLDFFLSHSTYYLLNYYIRYVFIVLFNMFSLPRMSVP